MNANIDGKLSLDEQGNIIHAAEQVNNAQLTAYQVGSGEKNLATLTDAPLGQDIPNLVLIEVPSSASIGSIVAAQLAQGKNLIFYNPILVNGISKNVAGFR